MASSGKIRFPILKNVDYIDLIKNKVTVLSIDGKDIEGLKWREFQKYVGKKLPSQTYFYSLKLNDDDTLHRGNLKAIGSILKSKIDNPSDYESLQKTVAALNNKLNEVSSNNGVSVDMLLEVTKSSYSMQISFLNNEITKKNNEIEKLINKVDSLNDELGVQDEEIEELKSKTDVSQYIKLATDVFNKKMNTPKASSGLEDVILSSTPDEIIQILNSVDWEKIPEKELADIISYMKMFTQQLPLKGK